jgi:5-methylcytosine-specific restriction endonuclease McrA
LQWWCRDCFKAYYAEQRAHHRRRNNALKAVRVEAAQAFVLDHLRSHPCVDCGEGDPIVLEFDHLGVKRAEVSTLVSRGVRKPVLVTEIARCEVACANCHRRRTARRGRWRRLQGGADNRPVRSQAHARTLRVALDALAASGCVDCGEADVCVLDFDHVGEKTATVTHLVRREVGLQRLRDEIARCEVRCANCHRRRTAVTSAHYRARTETGIPPARVELALPD